MKPIETKEQLYRMAKLEGRQEREKEIMDKMIELADKRHRWGKLWNYLKQIKQKGSDGK